MNVDQLKNIIDWFFVILLFHIVLGFPEINFDWSLESKFIWIMEKLNSFLGILDILVKNITLLVVWEWFSIYCHSVLFKFCWSNFTSFWKFSSKFFLSDAVWNKLDKDVWLEYIIEILCNLGVTSSSTKFILFFIDMRSNNQALITKVLFEMKAINSLLCFFMVWETNKSSSVVFVVHLARVYCSKLCKYSFQLFIREISRKIAHKKICELFFSSTFSVIFLWVNFDFNFVSFKSWSVEFFNCFACIFFSVKLNIPETSACTIFKNFEFTRFDTSEFLEHTAESKLINILWKVQDKEVSISVKITILLLVEDNSFVVNFGIVLFFKTSFCFFCTVEIQISKASWLRSFSVEHYFSTSKLISFGLEELVQILVKSDVWEVTNVETIVLAEVLLYDWLLSHWSEISKIHSLWNALLIWPWLLSVHVVLVSTSSLILREASWISLMWTTHHWLIWWELLLSSHHHLVWWISWLLELHITSWCSWLLWWHLRLWWHTLVSWLLWGCWLLLHDWKLINDNKFNVIGVSFYIVKPN